MTEFDVVLFGLKFHLKRIAFTLPIGGGWSVYWYGIIIATGFLLAILYANRNAGRFGIDKDRMLDVILVTTPVSILCARIYYLTFDGEKLTSVKDFFGFNGSGFAGIAIYGGVIGAFSCGALMCWLRKIKILDMFDLAALGFLIGQGIGRWGNFMNQEAYGKFTGSSWWGMRSDLTVREMGEGLVHPCFLYESIWCLGGFLLLHHLSKKRKFSGEVALMYCIWYGFGRALIEPLRTDSLMIGRIRVSCLVSILICLAGLILLLVFRKKAIREEAERSAEYTDMITPAEETAAGEIENAATEEIVSENTVDKETKEGEPDVQID